ncbi:MAG: Hsp20/alpha crystallin family protein [Nocardioidaceae bacterium]
MTMPARREPRRLSDVFDWLEEEFPPLPLWRSFEPRWPRIEDFQEEGRYVIRAELPGIDPEKDVEITIADGVLTVQAERREETKEGKRSEFRYGAFSRSCPLPKGADEGDVSATYTDGILEISVAMKEEEPVTKRIEISKA